MKGVSSEQRRYRMSGQACSHHDLESRRVEFPQAKSRKAGRLGKETGHGERVRIADPMVQSGRQWGQVLSCVAP